jgi:hypothetical protein
MATAVVTSKIQKAQLAFTEVTIICTILYIIVTSVNASYTFCIYEVTTAVTICNS